MTLAGLIAALGLVIAAEGMLYATFPAAVRRALAMLSALPDPSLRTLGLVGAAMGTGLLLLAGAI